MSHYLVAIIVSGIAFQAQIAPSYAQDSGAKAQSVYNNFWRPLTESEVKSIIQNNLNNGVALEPLMMRAVVQKKTRWYLSAIKTASDANPKNATLRAAYGWALAKSNFNYTMQGSSTPEDIAQKYPLDNQSIWNILQSARDIDSKCWMAYMGEAALPLGASMGQPTKSAALTKQAFNIQNNVVTLAHYGSELIWQGGLMRDVKQKKAGLRLLELAHRRYPNYYRINVSLYYAYRHPGIENKAKADAAKKRYLDSIPPESRSLPWVRDYLKYLGLT